VAQRPSVRWNESKQRWMAWVRFPDGSRRKVERVDKAAAERDLNELLALRAEEASPGYAATQSSITSSNVAKRSRRNGSTSPHRRGGPTESNPSHQGLESGRARPRPEPPPVIRIFWSLVFIDPHVVPLCQCVNEANAGNLKGRVRHSPIHLVIRPDVPERGPRPLPRAYALQVADAAVHGVYPGERRMRDRRD
jgi:hypothetical protein